MKDALISMVIPVYNVERYLRRCLKSVQMQTYTNLEIILVDDGSTDASGVICEQLAASDDRIRVIHKENGGLSDARNVGMQYASGDYIAFVDSDDYIAENMVARLYNICEQKNTEISICRSKKTSQDRERGACNQDIEVYTNVEALEQLFYQKKYNMSAWGKLYERTLFEGIRFPKGELYEDVNTIYKVIDRAKNVGYCGDQLYFYYINPQSITRNEFHRGKLAYIAHMDEVFSYVRERHPELLRAVKFRYLWANIHIWVHIPSTVEFRDMERKVRDNIKRYRWGVLIDGKIGIKNRMIILMTYGGHRFMQLLFQIAG